jgi:hypothetical protein
MKVRVRPRQKDCAIVGVGVPKIVKRALGGRRGVWRRRRGKCDV